MSMFNLTPENQSHKPIYAYLVHNNKCWDDLRYAILSPYCAGVPLRVNANDPAGCAARSKYTGMKSRDLSPIKTVC